MGSATPYGDFRDDGGQVLPHGHTKGQIDIVLGRGGGRPLDLPKWARSAWERKGKRAKFTPTKREMVYRRDGFRCVTCGTSLHLTIDHKVPKVKGGTNHIDNLQTMCGPCNHEKGCS